MREFNRKQIADLTTIMGIEKSMIPLLPLFRPKSHLLSPWEKKLPSLFRKLKLKRGMSVLDIPCGQGGVSVPLAKRYGVRVTGYDLIPEYIQYANRLADKMKVSNLCHFKISDIRTVVQKNDFYDLLLWVGAPHVWGGTKATINRLRKPLKKDGLIFMADAYLYPKIPKNGIYKNYDFLKDLKGNLTANGDKILSFYDYKNSLWDHDRRMVYEEVLSAFNNAKTRKEHILLSKLQKNLESVYHLPKHEIGLFVAVLKKCSG